MSALAQRKLHFKCPACKRALRAVESMQTATQVVTRKCPRCGHWWQITVAPTVGPTMAIDVGTFTEITEKEGR